MTGNLNGKRVLLVEDELLIALNAEEILRDLEADVIGPACTLDEAWSISTRESFDCAMLDRNLNGELSDGLAKELLNRGIAVILATGYGSEADDPDIPVVSKPYDDRMVAEAFREALKKQSGVTS